MIEIGHYLLRFGCFVFFDKFHFFDILRQQLQADRTAQQFYLYDQHIFDPYAEKFTFDSSERATLDADFFPLAHAQPLYRNIALEQLADRLDRGFGNGGGLGGDPQKADGARQAGGLPKRLPIDFGE